ncbi:MAG: PEP-CTERM sorting domain-containing protein [Bryobacteraceae bacterium]
MNKIKYFVLLASMIFCCSAYAQIDSDGTAPGGAPEPATIALMGVGLAGIGVAAWRRNRRK